MTSPLHSAVLLDDKGKAVNTLQILFDNGANPDIKDAFERTPLYYALACSDIKLAKFLVNYGAQIDSDLLLLAEYHKERDVIRTALANFDDDFHKFFIKVISAGSNEKAFEDREYYTMLCAEFARRNTSQDISELFFINCGYGTYADKQIECSKILLSFDADVNYINTDIRTKKRNKKLSCLMEACFRKKTEMVKFLLRNGAHINQVVNGRTALMHACFSGSLEIVKILIEHGADVSFEYNGRSALSIVKKMGKRKEIADFIEEILSFTMHS